jgi:hypothetical protein
VSPVHRRKGPIVVLSAVTKSFSAPPISSRWPARTRPTSSPFSSAVKCETPYGCVTVYSWFGSRPWNVAWMRPNVMGPARNAASRLKSIVASFPPADAVEEASW